MKPRYSFTIISPNETAQNIENWIFINWGYDYWDMDWEIHEGMYQDFLINLHP